MGRPASGLFPTRVNGAAPPVEWSDRGLCRAAPGLPWSAGREALTVPEECAELCRRCPVKPECLVWALEADEHGVWGNTTHAQREQLKSRRLRSRCPSCGCQLLLRTSAADVCAGCGVSWMVRERTV